MAEVRPLNALHYNLAAVPSLADVVAPPYDVIDAERAARAARALAVQRRRARPAGGARRRRPLRARRRDARGVDAAGHPRRRPRAGDLGADPGVRRRPTARGTCAAGLLCRVRVTPYGPGGVRPHERTQPGPKEDRLRLTEATRHNLSPIFSLHPGDAWRHLDGLHPRRALGRGHRRRRAPSTGSGGSATPTLTAPSPPSSPTPSC